jgi:hypothetical protein
MLVADYKEATYGSGEYVISSSDTNSGWKDKELLAMYNIGRVYDYYADHGLYSVDGSGIPIAILSGVCEADGTPVDNAYFNGFRDGFGLFAISDINDSVECLDIMGHEFTHGITSYSMGGSSYVNELGAINEAFSDIMGNLCELTYAINDLSISRGTTTGQFEITGTSEYGSSDDPDPAYPDWRIGEMGGRIYRDMSDPVAYRQPAFVRDAYYCLPTGHSNVVGNDYDPSIVTKADFEPFDASLGSVVHIRMRTQIASYLDLYYTTDTDSEWTGPKHFSKVPCKTGEFIDLYFDFGKTPGWNGKITGFRFDPVSDPFTAEIELFEILGKNDQLPDYSIVVNGMKINTTFVVDKAEDGDFVLFAKEEDCAFARLRLFYEYDRDPGLVKFYSYDEQTLELAVGSDKAVLNGKTVDLGYKFDMFDGLPVLHVKKICDLLGYKYQEDNDTLNITAATQKELERLSQNNA